MRRLRFYYTFTEFIPGNLLRCFQSIHIVCNVFVRWETTTSTFSHSENIITTAFELRTCSCRCINYQEKYTGKQEPYLVSTLPFNPFHITDLLQCPWKSEKGKWCYFNFFKNNNEWLLLASFRCLTHLEWLRDVELVLFKFNFATKYKVLHLIGHGIYSQNSIK